MFNIFNMNNIIFTIQNIVKKRKFKELNQTEEEYKRPSKKLKVKDNCDIKNNNKEIEKKYIQNRRDMLLYT